MYAAKKARPHIIASMIKLIEINVFRKIESNGVLAMALNDEDPVDGKENKRRSATNGRRTETLND